MKGEKVWIQKGNNLLNVHNILENYSSATIVEQETNRVVLKGIATSYQYLTLTIDLKAGTYSFQRN